MSESPPPLHLTDGDVKVVLQAIREGRVRGLDDQPYDPEEWNEEAVCDWLEHNHEPSHARYMITILGKGQRVKSRPTTAAADVALRALARRVAQLEDAIATLRKRLPN